jgi:hypothetical protein
MAEKKFAVPEILAILPVRDTVLFPGAVLPLTVGRESSLAIVNSLEAKKSFWELWRSWTLGLRILPPLTCTRLARLPKFIRP